MAFFSPAPAPVKKKPLYTPVVNQSTYQTPIASQAPKPTQTPAPSYKSPFSSQTPNLANKLQMSSATNSNAQIYNPTPQPQPEKKPIFDPTANYMSETDKLRQQQERQLLDSLNANKGSATRFYDEKKRLLQSSADPLNDEAKALETEANLKVNRLNEDRPGEIQKISDTYGEAQRGAALSRREAEGRANQRFAQMNTYDSQGAGSREQAQQGIEQGFQDFTNKNLTDKSNAIVGKNRQVDDEIYSVQQFARNEKAKLNAQIRQIQSDTTLNDIEKETVIRQLEDETEASLLQAKDYVNQLSYQQQMSTQSSGVSDEFLRTGVPKTAAEFEFLQKNKDAFANKGGQGSGQSKSVGLIDGILQNPGAISGPIRSGQIPIINQLTGGGDIAAKWEGLKNLLALAGRGQLKGSGAVSDFEARMLEKAALAGLDPSKQTEAQFIAGLQQLKQDLMSGGANPNMSSMPGSVTNPSDPLGLFL